MAVPKTTDPATGNVSTAIITGAGHLLGSFLPFAFDGEAAADQAMRDASLDLGLQSNFMLLFDAMSQLMSVMFIAFGVITLAVARNAPSCWPGDRR